MKAFEVVRLVRANFKRRIEQDNIRLQEPGSWALLAYRLTARTARMQSGLGRAATGTAAGLLAFVADLFGRTSIAPGAKVGAAFHLIHPRNVSIADGVEIGDRVGVMHEVTIGPGYDGVGVPRIGNDVFVGVGAAVLGSVTIGDGAMVAANSLVTCDVPAGAFAVGVPAKVGRWSATPAPAGGASTATMRRA
jgi:serine O-acetyltransferase